MISAYHSIVAFDGDDFSEYLERISLIGVFKELIEKYKADKALLKCIIRYIVMAYSKDSDRIIVDSDWQKNKKRIFEEAMLPPVAQVQNDIIYLQDEVVVATIHRWLNFQDDETFTQLSVLKDLKVEMQVAANSAIKKSSGEIDYDQKFKNAKYVNDLRDMIKALESELMQNDNRFKEAVKEVKRTKEKNTIGPELWSN